MPKRLTLIIGVILALASVILVKVFLDQRSREMMDIAKKLVQKEREDSVAVMVANKDIPRGTTIETNMLQSIIITSSSAQPGAATSADRLVGMKAVVDIFNGQQITRNMVVMPKEEVQAGGSLAMSIPIGKRAVAVMVDNISSVGGMVRPGDYVDVIALLQLPVQTIDGRQSTQVATVPLFQNVLILAVGQDISSPEGAKSKGRYEKEEPRREASPMITLALSPQETNLATFVVEQGGRLRLVLRSPADAQLQNVPPASWDTVFQYLNLIPQEKSQAEIEAAEAKTRRRVDIYRGTKKEELYLRNN